MVVCKFFLQGTCKFGDFCNFEHQINDSFNNYQNGTSILRKPNFGTTQSQSNFGTPQIQPSKPSIQTSTNTVDTSTLVKSVVNDMTSAEKGGQWLFSCYAPYKEKPAFPGFEDQSFEELRHGYYEALKSGALEQYKQQVYMMIQQIQMKIKTLQNPSPDMINLLKSIYNTPPSTQSGVFSGNLFNSPNTTSLNQQGTGFGQQSSSIFAQANQNLFGGTQQQQTTPQNTFGSTGSNIFGTTTQNTIFGGQTVGNNPFTAPQPSSQTSNANIFSKNNFNFASAANSLFGPQQSPLQQKTGSIFGGNNNASTTAQPVPQQNVFGSQNIFAQPIQQNTGIFSTASVSQQPQTNIFASQPIVHTSQATSQSQPTNIFGAVATQTKTAGSIFGQQTGDSFGSNPNSIFGSAKSNAVAPEYNSNIFGGSTVASILVQPDKSLYSKLEDLTNEEIKWFQSDDLDINGIPEKPPTYEMCFKT